MPTVYWLRLARFFSLLATSVQTLFGGRRATANTGFTADPLLGLDLCSRSIVERRVLLSCGGRLGNVPHLIESVSRECEASVLLLHRDCRSAGRGRTGQLRRFRETGVGRWTPASQFGFGSAG